MKINVQTRRIQNWENKKKHDDRMVWECKYSLPICHRGWMKSLQPEELGIWFEWLNTFLALQDHQFPLPSTKIFALVTAPSTARCGSQND